MIPLKDLCTVEGTKTVLETKISVQDISSIKWYHNDKLLTSSERVQMVVKGAKQRLVFTRTHASDEGNYKLVVGRAETSCQLSVQSKNHYGGTQQASELLGSSCLHSEGGFCRGTWNFNARGKVLERLHPMTSLTPQYLKPFIMK